VTDFPTRLIELTPFQEWLLIHTCTLWQVAQRGSPDWKSGYCQACADGPPKEIHAEVQARFAATQLASSLNPPKMSMHEISLVDRP
jgi:hypothetical protein